MSARTTIALLVVTLAVAPAQTGSAQTCFPAQRLPHCRHYPIFELGYAHRLGGGPLLTGGTPQVHYLNGELGWMFNRSPDFALGGTLFLGGLVDYAFELRPGLKARARYWVGRRVALDVGAGAILGRVPVDTAIGLVEQRRLGGVGHLGLSLHDALHLTVQVEYLPNPVDRDLVGYLGARLGSKPALWSAGIVAPVLLLGAAAMAD